MEGGGSEGGTCRCRRVWRWEVARWEESGWWIGVSLDGALKFHSQIVSFRYQYQCEALRHEYQCSLPCSCFPVVEKSMALREELTLSPQFVCRLSKRKWVLRDLSAREIVKQGMSKSNSFSSKAISAHVHWTCCTCYSGRWGRGRS